MDVSWNSCIARADRRTDEAGQGGQDALVGQEQVEGVAQLALGLKGLVLALQLGQAHDLLDACALLLRQARLGLLVALACIKGVSARWQHCERSQHSRQAHP